MGQQDKHTNKQVNKQVNKQTSKQRISPCKYPGSGYQESLENPISSRLFVAL